MKCVYQYDLNWNFIRKWASRKLAVEELKVSGFGISQCCNQKAKTCGGYKWSNILLGGSNE